MSFDKGSVPACSRIAPAILVAKVTEVQLPIETGLLLSPKTMIENRFFAILMAKVTEV